MIAHVVMFRPRHTLTDSDRAALVDAFARALREIPSIRRSRVGRRILHGRGYEQAMREDYEYAAILEFDDLAALRAYLDDPAHEELAQRFFAAFDAALIYDYEVQEGTTGLTQLANG
jgi:Stress responsive A/B Barrel Domain